jgi:hypothetical protein
MSPPKKPEKGSSEQPTEDHSEAAEDAPAWTQGLKQLYDSVVDEPLPDSFKDLLDAFDEQGESGKDAEAGKSA